MDIFFGLSDLNQRYCVIHAIPYTMHRRLELHKQASEQTRALSIRVIYSMLCGLVLAPLALILITGIHKIHEIMLYDAHYRCCYCTLINVCEMFALQSSAY